MDRSPANDARVTGGMVLLGMRRCAACNRRLPERGGCVCGVTLARAPEHRPWLSLEQHLGIEEDDVVRPDSGLTMTFGEPVQAPQPEGTTVLRRFRHLLEVSWHGPAFVDDLRWENVFIVHYRGPLSAPPWNRAVPAFVRLRELRDGTVGLFDELLSRPPPELRSMEVHVSLRDAERVVRDVERLPSLEYLQLHFPAHDEGLVLTDSLLERYSWLDCRALTPGTSLFSVRR